MHFRTRKNVVQLVRTNYDAGGKKPKAEVVGSIPLRKPDLTDALRDNLSDNEIAEFESWKKTQQHAAFLREELAALTLVETIDLASRWFVREGESEAARAAAIGILAELPKLRKVLTACAGGS
jgi:hypothetical protein